MPIRLAQAILFPGSGDLWAFVKGCRLAILHGLKSTADTAQSANLCQPDRHGLFHPVGDRFLVAQTLYLLDASSSTGVFYFF